MMALTRPSPCSSKLHAAADADSAEPAAIIIAPSAINTRQIRRTKMAVAVAAIMSHDLTPLCIPLSGKLRDPSLQIGALRLAAGCGLRHDCINNENAAQKATRHGYGRLR
jgi:hypothetical protein